MPRPTVRGYALLGLALATYLAGRLVGTWELYLFAVAFLAAVVLSWLSVVATGRRMRATRTLTPERPVAGDEPEFAFCLKNESYLPGPELTLRSRLVGMCSSDLELEVESLAPREERVLKTHAGRVNRGVHVLPPAEALAEDHLGIVKAVHKISDPLVVTVFPRIAYLDSCALYPDLGLKHDWSGRHGLLAFGASEFRGVRPHQPGEPLSHIDWKSTAKTGILMLREMEEPAGADITMLLDGTAQELLGKPPDTNFELAVRAAGSIADFVLRANRGVTLLCHERSWRQVRLTPDGGGRRALLQALAETRPNASAPLLNALRHLRTDGPHLLRAQSVTVVGISLDRHLARALIQLREDGVKLSFLHITGGSFATEPTEGVSSLLPFLPPRDTGAAPAGLRPGDQNASSGSAAPAASGRGAGLSAEARALLLSLSSAGIPCLTLSHGEDLVRNLSLWHAGRRTGTAAR
jgi:uncharacterized protein (DUF58 family)